MAVKGNIRKKHKKTEVSRVEETAGTDVDGKFKKKGPKWSQFNTLGEVQFVILSIELATQTRRWRPAKI